MEQSIVTFLERILPDATSIVVEDFQQIAGGFSRETFKSMAIAPPALKPRKNPYARLRMGIK